MKLDLRDILYHLWWFCTEYFKSFLEVEIVWFMGSIDESISSELPWIPCRFPDTFYNVYKYTFKYFLPFLFLVHLFSHIHGWTEKWQEYWLNCIYGALLRCGLVAFHSFINISISENDLYWNSTSKRSRFQQRV